MRPIDDPDVWLRGGLGYLRLFVSYLKRVEDLLRDRDFPAQTVLLDSPGRYLLELGCYGGDPRFQFSLLGDQIPTTCAELAQDQGDADPASSAADSCASLNFRPCS